MGPGGGHHVLPAEERCLEQGELGLGFENSRVTLKLGSAHYPTTTVQGQHPLTGCPSRGFRPVAATPFVAPNAVETTGPDTGQGSLVTTETSPFPAPSLLKAAQTPSVWCRKDMGLWRDAPAEERSHFLPSSTDHNPSCLRCPGPSLEPDQPAQT